MKVPGDILWMGKREFNREQLDAPLFTKGMSFMQKVYRITFPLTLGFILLLIITGLVQGKISFLSLLFMGLIFFGFAFTNYISDKLFDRIPTTSIEYTVTTKGVVFSEKFWGKRKYHFVDYRAVSDITYNRLRKGEGKIYLITKMPKNFNIGDHYPTIEINQELEKVFERYLIPCWKYADKQSRKDQ